MINKSHLEYFISVAEHKSLTDAARDLYISPQALSKQINKLESLVGAKLLLRTNKGIHLTESGKLFYQESKQLLCSWEMLLAKLRDSAQESVENITYATFGGGFMNLLKPILPVYSQRYPMVKQIGVFVRPEQWLTKLRDVENGSIDIFEHADVPLIHSMGLDTTFVKHSECVCILASNHRLSKKKSIKLSDLDGFEVVIQGYDCVPDIKERMMHEAPRAKFLEDSRGTVSAMEICGKGGIYITSAAHYSVFEPLLTIPLKEDLRWTYVLVHRKNPSTAVTNLLEIAKKHYGSPV